MDSTSATSVTLARRLGLTSGVMVTVGGVIGSGIFLKPYDVARSLPSETWIHGAWIALGLVSLFGALAYAELGAMYPQAGGQYAFLRESWGRFPAFLYGWCFLLVINPGTLAGLAVAFSDQLVADEGARLGLALGMIAVLGVVNHLGVGWGALVQNAATFAKLGALLLLVIGAYFLLRTNGDEVAPPASAGTTLSFATGLLAIFWAYEGWYQLPYSAAELKNPERDLPRGLIWGMLTLIATYLIVNAVYLHAVPLQEMRGLESKEQVPLLTVTRTFGENAGGLLTALVCVSVFGAANPNLLSSPRGFFAMAQDGLLPRPLMYVHPVWRTPTVAIWVQAAWAAALVFLLKQDFQDLTEFVIFASLIFYALTVAGVYVLRRRLPDAPRPYRCFGYPWSPALFIAVMIVVDLYVLAEPANRTNALFGLLIIASGVPVYFAMARRSERSAPFVVPLVVTLAAMGVGVLVGWLINKQWSSHAAGAVLHEAAPPAPMDAATAVGVGAVALTLVAIMWVAAQTANTARYRAVDAFARGSVSHATSATHDFVDCYKYALFQIWIVCLLVGCMGCVLHLGYLWYVATAFVAFLVSYSMFRLFGRDAAEVAEVTIDDQRGLDMKMLSWYGLLKASWLGPFHPFRRRR